MNRCVTRTINTALATSGTDAGVDAARLSELADLHDHELGNFHSTNVLVGDDPVSQAREETQAQLRHLDREAEMLESRSRRLESQRRGLDMARGDLEGRLRQLILEHGGGGLEMLDDGF